LGPQTSNSDQDKYLAYYFQSGILSTDLRPLIGRRGVILPVVVVVVVVLTSITSWKRRYYPLRVVFEVILQFSIRRV